MRTTVDLDADTERAVQALRREGKGLSAAVNELIRRGVMSEPVREPFVPRSRRLGIKIDVSNVSDALEVLEGPEAR